jgi:hypothetical protein
MPNTRTARSEIREPGRCTLLWMRYGACVGWPAGASPGALPCMYSTLRTLASLGTIEISMRRFCWWAASVSAFRSSCAPKQPRRL